MNREIIFRGKRVDNGEWVFGSYNKIVGDAEIMTRFDVTDNRNHEFKNVAFDIHLITETVLPDSQGWDYSGCFRHHKVDPTTIGQYTGLTDSKGNKVFEGDIESSGGVVKLGIYEMFSDRSGFPTWISERKNGASFVLVCDNEFKIGETIVGTIHDTHLTQQS